MNNSRKNSTENFDSLIDTRGKNIQCNESLWSLFPHDEVCNATDLFEDKETYLQRSLAFLIVGFTGILSNLVTIYVLGSSVKIRQKLVNTLIIHQSFIDLLASISLVGMAHLDGTDQHGLEGLHAKVYCYFVANKFPLWSMMDVSSFSLMFLNIERYISIVFPIYHHTKVTRKKVVMFLPIVWILGIAEGAFACSAFTAVDGACAFGNQKLFDIESVFFIIVHFFLPVILVLFLYGHIFICLRSSVKANTDSTSSNRSDLMEKAKNNVFKTMVLLTICYVICYAFNSVYITLLIEGTFDYISGEYLSEVKILLTIHINI